MKPRYWKKKPAQVVLEAARKKVSRGTRYFNDAKELLALVAQKLELEHGELLKRIDQLENPTLEQFSKSIARVQLEPEAVTTFNGESPKAIFDRRLRELEENE